MTPRHVEVHFKRLRPSGRTLAIVLAGREVYSALHESPFEALRAAAGKASQELRRLGLDASHVIQRGLARAPWMLDERAAPLRPMCA